LIVSDIPSIFASFPLFIEAVYLSLDLVLSVNFLFFSIISHLTSQVRIFVAKSSLSVFLALQFLIVVDRF